MTLELWLVVWAVVLCLAQALVATTGMAMKVGAGVLAQNREDLPAFTGWTGRAIRAHRNMLENLVLFVALVLVARAAGAVNEMVLLGAEIFLGARLVYAVVYIAGIPWLRTIVWLISVIGLILIFAQLFVASA